MILEVQVYANNQPDDLLQSIQQHFDNPIGGLSAGPEGSHVSTALAAVGNLNPSALRKTINFETENTLKVFQNYFGPYPYRQIAVTNIMGTYGQGWPGLLYLSCRGSPFWTTRSGTLIYLKGGYVLQMIRLRLRDPRSADPEHIFKETMQDYCKTYDNKAASTEDFKTIVEKHMTKSMDLDGDHKMDWFFNEYVYGTGIPRYTLLVSLAPTPDGKTTLTGQLDRGAG